MRRLSEHYDLWKASKVQRLHTMQTIRPQNNAEHSFDMIVTLLRWYPNFTKDMIIWAVRHDLGEDYSGDLPSNVMSDNPELAKVVHEKQEDHTNNSLGMKFDLEITNVQKKCLHLVDKFDFLVFCYNEFRMGNSTLRVPVIRSVVMIRKIIAEIYLNETDEDARTFCRNIATFSDQIHDEIVRVKK